MPRGTLEVILVSAKGLAHIDFLSKTDPYVILTYRTQQHRSSVAKVSDSESELNLRIMDKDTFTDDDFVGEAIIFLEPVFVNGSVPETAYVVVKDEKYSGEIKVALTFTPERGRGIDEEEEEISKLRPWKE
ncbi:hypothetical protein L6164_021081 [Bauhinia variegata]|uniref:Uncharacterized protein n=1 Tax=Bauhinia variegata TaxID=167791 RepID=A0ACB9MXF5_BAUVA|nr:hypothetical protein L6164_021081 [Bauhinia variegata]